MRGFVERAEITPKFAEPKVVPGFENCGVLNALKNSERNARFTPSRNGIAFETMMATVYTRTIYAEAVGASKVNCRNQALHKHAPLVRWVPLLEASPLAENDRELSPERPSQALQFQVPAPPTHDLRCRLPPSARVNPQRNR